MLTTACKCSPRRDRVALPRYADLEHEIESWVREQRMRQWVRQHQRLERQYWERQQQRHLSFERLVASAAPPRRRSHASVTETADHVDVDAAIRQAGAEAVAARDATAAAADRSEAALQRAALAATSGDTAGARLAALEADAAADEATQAVARAQSEAALVAAMGNAARAQANASRAQSIAASAETGFLIGEPSAASNLGSNLGSNLASNRVSALPPWPALPPMPEVDRCVPVLPDDIRRKLQLLLALKFRLSLAAAADVEAFPARHATSATHPPAASAGHGTGPAAGASAPTSAPLATPLGSDRSAGSQDGDLCFICYSGPRDAVLLECGHGGLCFGCATRCMQMRFQECPICRQPISQIVQLELTERRGERAKRGTDGVVLTIAQAGQLTQLDSVSEEDEEASDVDALQSTRANANEPVRLLDA